MLNFRGVDCLSTVGPNVSPKKNPGDSKNSVLSEPWGSIFCEDENPSFVEGSHVDLRKCHVR